jgi:hypothetical protein
MIYTTIHGKVKRLTKKRTPLKARGELRCLRHPWQVDLGHGKVDFQTSVVRGQVDCIVGKSNFQKLLVHKIQMSCTKTRI